MECNPETKCNSSKKRAYSRVPSRRVQKIAKLFPLVENFTGLGICSFQDYLARCFRAIWRNVSELFGVHGVSLCRSQDCPAPLQPLHWI
jgi:hypothetical protein